MNKRSVRSEDRGFYRWAFAVHLAPIERNANDVLKVKINCVGSDSIGKPVERLLYCVFEFLEDTYNCIDSGLVYRAARSVDKQTNIFVKFDIRRKLHVNHPDKPPGPFLRWMFFWSRANSLPIYFSVSNSSGTFSHSAAFLRSSNTHTLSGEP